MRSSSASASPSGRNGASAVKRALVTGATGMLGSYIVERLVADGRAFAALLASGAGSDVTTTSA